MRRLTVEEFSKNLRPGLDERMWAPRISLRGDLLAAGAGFAAVGRVEAGVARVVVR